MNLKKTWFSYVNFFIGTVLMSVLLFTLLVSLFEFNGITMSLFDVQWLKASYVCAAAVILCLFFVFFAYSFIKRNFHPETVFSETWMDILTFFAIIAMTVLAVYFGYAYYRNYTIEASNPYYAAALNYVKGISAERINISYSAYVSLLGMALKLFGTSSSVIIVVNAGIAFLTAFFACIAIKSLFGRFEAVFTYGFLLASFEASNCIGSPSYLSLSILTAVFLFMMCALIIKDRSVGYMESDSNVILFIMFGLAEGVLCFMEPVFTVLVIILAVALLNSVVCMGALNKAINRKALPFFSFLLSFIAGFLGMALCKSFADKCSFADELTAVKNSFTFSNKFDTFYPSEYTAVVVLILFVLLFGNLDLLFAKFDRVGLLNFSLMLFASIYGFKVFGFLNVTFVYMFLGALFGQGIRSLFISTLPVMTEEEELAKRSKKKSSRKSAKSHKERKVKEKPEKKKKNDGNNDSYAYEKNQLDNMKAAKVAGAVAMAEAINSIENDYQIPETENTENLSKEKTAQKEMKTSKKVAAAAVVAEKKTHFGRHSVVAYQPRIIDDEEDYLEKTAESAAFYDVNHPVEKNDEMSFEDADSFKRDSISFAPEFAAVAGAFAPDDNENSVEESFIANDNSEDINKDFDNTDTTENVADAGENNVIPAAWLFAKESEEPVTQSEEAAEENDENIVYNAAYFSLNDNDESKVSTFEEESKASENIVTEDDNYSKPIYSSFIISNSDFRDESDNDSKSAEEFLTEANDESQTDNTCLYKDLIIDKYGYFDESEDESIVESEDESIDESKDESDIVGEEFFVTDFHENDSKEEPAENVETLLDEPAVKLETVDKDIDETSETVEEDITVKQEPLHKVILFDNPLPLPKKPVKKPLEFDKFVYDNRMNFDVDVSDSDDFDL